MKNVSNLMIRASAGTGKTYQLTNRFIKLLICGQPVERIIALTFTRKAAGEFFESILTKLAEASGSAEVAKRLAGEIDLPKTKPADFRAALRILVEGMGQMSLATIDSFFHRVLGLFSLEFGLGGEFEMMSEFEKQQARLTVLENLLAENAARKTDSDSLIDSYRLATAGMESRNFIGSFMEHLKDCHELRMRVPSSDFWGDSRRIWPAGIPWKKQKGELENLVEDWRSHIEEHADFSKEVHRNWNALAEHLQQWAVGKDLFKKSPTLIKQAMAGLARMKLGKWGFEFRKKTYVTTADFSQKLASILQHCVAEELEAKLDRTAGVYGLLDVFEKLYATQVRRQGRLTFADLPVLLASREDQLELEYRLDGTFDHWLLDEFQDTSGVQWRAMANLIDEVVQDPSGERSFFCVGDPKQSLYQWRGGDPRLFDRVEEQYNQGTDNEFTTTSLDESWRSCPDILEFINTVFGDEAVLREFDENKTAALRWSAIWNKHEPATPRKKEEGHSLYLTVDGESQRWPMVAHLLERLQPIANGLECAILVQSNKTVREVVNFLRKELPGMPVAGESATNPGADNPLGAALLSLFRAAAHPKDRFSAGHVRLTPLAEHLSADPDELQNELRILQRDIHQRGFELVARHWIQKLNSDLDDFAHWRAVQFLELARQFDESGSRDIDAFMRFMPAQELTDASGANVVQVMTIHKAKGLTFDITLVPDLEGSRLDSTRKDALHTHANDNGEPEWILDMPKQAICEIDGVLSDALTEARSEACYENFCKLYVALTRARFGLYVITTAPSGKSQNYAKLLSETLATGDGKPFGDEPASANVMFEAGDFGWVKTTEEKAKLPIAKYKPVAAERRHPRLSRRRPSAHGGMKVSGANLFDSHGMDAASFGSEVHAIFEDIEWKDENTAATLEQHRKLFPDATDEVERCLRVDGIAEMFKPIEQAAVWRERAFELVLEGEFCSGVFDRVVLFGDTAHIIDFKTDRVNDDTIADAAEHHQPQLALYRRVLARLTGLSEKAITCKLVFTRSTQVVEV